MVSYLVQLRRMVGQYVAVLILVVVEDGLVLLSHSSILITQQRLNPCCSGRWSRTEGGMEGKERRIVVLILVVVEDGLVHIH